MKRRLLTRIGLEDDVCFSYAVLQPGEENSARSVISLLTWLFSDDVDFLSAGLQPISILALGLVQWVGVPAFLSQLTRRRQQAQATGTAAAQVATDGLDLSSGARGARTARACARSPFAALLPPVATCQSKGRKATPVLRCLFRLFPSTTFLTPHSFS